MKSVGQSIRKVDGMAIATGKPVYTQDIAMSHALVVAGYALRRQYNYCQCH